MSDQRQKQADEARAKAREAAEKSGVQAAKTQGKDERGVEEQAIGARQDPEDLARDTAAMQGRSGVEGLDPSEPKDTLIASPGAQFDPAAVPRTPGTGITSAPLGQPVPLSLTANQRTPDPYEFEDGESTVWGKDERTGKVIRPRTYPELENQDVLVIKSAYYQDAIRNEGEIIRGYSGPLASWMQPLDSRGQEIPRNRFKVA